MSKIHKISPTDPHFPQPLQHLHDTPKQMYWRGTGWQEFADAPRLAIVGSRKCSPYGRGVIEDIIESLAAYHVVIISGLALGSDGVAHMAALRNNLPTIAVLPTTVETIYPACHRQLAEDIVHKGGALASEYERGTPTMKHSFIARNRIIAALADVVLIPEAALNSGSLHTAKFALEIGREVLAVPGNITSPLSEGTNMLIKQGATPLTSKEDLIEILGLEKHKEKSVEFFADGPEELAILQALASGVREGTELYAASGMPLHTYQQTLTMLEIKGSVKSLGNDIWQLS